jgi:hypothetical protein
MSGSPPKNVSMPINLKDKVVEHGTEELIKGPGQSSPWSFSCDSPAVQHISRTSSWDLGTASVTT